MPLYTKEMEQDMKEKVNNSTVLEVTILEVFIPETNGAIVVCREVLNTE